MLRCSARDRGIETEKERDWELNACFYFVCEIVNLSSFIFEKTEISGSFVIISKKEGLTISMTETRGVRIALPHPWLTTFEVVSEQQQQKVSRLARVENKQEQPPAVDIHHPSLTFTEPSDNPTDREGEPTPPSENNTPWARARSSLSSKLAWDGNKAPTVAQIWTVIYALFTLRPAQETLRLTLDGPQAATLRSQLKAVGLAIAFPLPTAGEGNKKAVSFKLPDTSDELLVPRSVFWQGAGSPFGTRAPWTSDAYSGLDKERPLSSFPLMPLEYTFTHNFPDSRVFARHPIRPVKPTPGSVVYSRYIPHLDEHLSLVALDWENEEHVKLFNKWQNDPRVAAVWEETGTLEEHREYLRKGHEDNHIITLLGRFNDEYFAYFEVYWAKVCFTLPLSPLSFPSTLSRDHE